MFVVIVQQHLTTDYCDNILNEGEDCTYDSECTSGSCGFNRKYNKKFVVKVLL